MKKINNKDKSIVGDVGVGMGVGARGGRIGRMSNIPIAPPVAVSKVIVMKPFADTVPSAVVGSVVDAVVVPAETVDDAVVAADAVGPVVEDAVVAADTADPVVEDAAVTADPVGPVVEGAVFGVGCVVEDAVAAVDAD